MAIQLVASAWVEISAAGQRLAAVEHADVVQPQEPALEDVAAVRVLAVDPPGEVQQQLVEDALQKRQVAGVAALLAVDLEYAPGGPGVHRRIDVAEGPFVGRQLAVGVHVPLARQAARAAPWRIRDRSAPAAGNETPDPKRHTRDIPTCRASR